MITSDPKARAARIVQLREILARSAAPQDKDLLASFAPVCYAEMPDRIALGLSIEVLAARLKEHFQFVVREMPPATQLYKGLPGIHVSARNASEQEARATGAGQGLPLETTIVETHTFDVPFIFESLKNYLQKADLRVFSAIHPTFSVRRQWERIVAIGGPQEDGSKESFCHFQIERVESKERLRRIEHEIFSVLKTVLTAVEDFQDMVRMAREIGPRLRSRRGQPGDAESARAFLDWLLADNYILIGMARYRLGADGLPDRVPESALGVFTDAALLPVVFPGVMEEVEGHINPSPDDERIVDIDHCNNASALYHLEPIDDIVIREWAADGTLAGAILLLGRFAKGAFTDKASDIPLLKEKQERLLADSGTVPNSHASREIRGVFNRFPKRELFYADVQSLKEHHRPHRLHGGRRRDRGSQPQRHGLRRPLHSVLAPALLLQDRGGAAESALRGLRPDLLQHLGRLRCRDPSPLLLRRTNQLERPIEIDAVRRIVQSTGHDLGGPRRRRPGDRLWRARGAAAVRALHTPRDAQWPVPRVHAPRRGRRGREAPREPRGAPRGRASSGAPRRRLL